MLTLQQLLESDSIATIVAKLNQNFQTLTLTNGGPQGIRGPQGIPGLPGKLGPIGPTGGAGPTGTIVGVIPFSAPVSTPGATATGIGPSVDTLPIYGTIGPWPNSSYSWLKKYYSQGFNGGQGQVPKPGDVFIDHGNNGYWKFLNAVDQDGAADPTQGFTTGGAYSFPGATTYPDLGAGGGYVGPGWYFYPVDVATSGGGGVSSNNVWIEDKTTYLVGNLNGGVGPYTGGNAYSQNPSPLTIANARLLSKYGTVWITSGNDQANSQSSESNNTTSTIQDWGDGPGGSLLKQPGRNNSGIDRLLFKMSIDGLPYKVNVKARGWTGTVGDNETFNTYDNLDYPSAQSGTITDINKYFIKPAYNVNLSEFTPLLFFSERKSAGTNDDDGRFSSLGYYLYTSTATFQNTIPTEPNPYGAGSTPDNNVSKSLHLFSSRYSPDPIKTFPNNFAGLNSGNTFNFGEFLLDFRKVVASNQYVCSVPSDLKISGDTRIGTNNFVTYDPTGSNFKYQVGQGYLSSINGRVITGPDGAVDYWEYGLGSSPTQGALTGFHDTASGIDGMVNRNTWYGTGVMKSPSDWDTDAVGDTQMYRIAGMMERGRKFTNTATREVGVTTSQRTHFLSELIFYTSQFKATGAVVGATAGSLPGNGLEGNTQNSKPAFYVSPYGNIGIGTFIGAGTSNDEYGPIEPGARLQVHVKKRDADYDPTWTYETITPSGLISNFPQHVFGVAAFTGEKDANLNVPSHAADVYFGFATTPSSELIMPSSNVINEYGISKGSQVAPSKGKKLRTALRAESWYSQHLSSMRFGVSPYVTDQTIGRNGADLFSKEFILSLAPINAVSSAASTSVSGVGIHNLFPRTRFHLFGKNINNEIEWGMETTLPSIASLGTALTSTSIFPFYNNPNTASTKQVSIDYLENTYKYPVGLYEYQYDVFSTSTTGWPVFQSLNATFAAPLSPNSSAYPNREKLGITRVISYSTSPYQWGNFSLGTSVPSAISANSANNSWRHGGESNGMYEPSSYLGFNLIRDLSSATGTGITNTLGDNADSTRWLIGTQGTGGAGNRGNNGAAAFMFSPHGELGLVTIPRGNDGGLAYEQWEQRGLGTRDILNQMKIVFDQNGNIAIGNGAGWDLDAYPSLERFSNGQLAYVPKYNSSTNNAMTELPSTANASFGLTAGYYFGSSLGKYGYLDYKANNTNYAETQTVSSASQINARNTKPEYIRLEVAAEKAWSRNGRSLQRLGWGYPTNSTIKITTPAALQRYIAFPAHWNLPADLSGVEWTLTTDAEGRLKTSVISRTSLFPTSVISDWKVIIYPHPREFNTGSPLNNTVTPFSNNIIAPPGAIAAEWAGMNDTPGDLTYGNSTMTIAQTAITLHFSVDERGSANVRLNNFVYGEGWGADGSNPDGVPLPTNPSDYTIKKVIKKRQESPKLIFSFLEKTPDAVRSNSGLMPYRKVNTVLMSAQNESALREFYIPKADNTGGTLMVFTDQFVKTKDQVGTFSDGNINIQPNNSSTWSGLYLEEVVTQEFLGGYRNPSDSVNVYINDSMGVPMVFNTINGTNSRIGDVFLDAERVTIPATSGLNSYEFLAGPKNLFPGFVRYFNTSRLQTTQKGKTTNFNAGEYGKIVSTFSGFDSINPTNPAPTAANNYSIAQRNSTREPDYTSISVQRIAQGPVRLNIVNDSRVPATLNIPMKAMTVTLLGGGVGPSYYASAVYPAVWSATTNSAWCNVNPVGTDYGNGLAMGDYINITTAQPSPALFGIGGYGGDSSTTSNWKVLPGSIVTGQRGMGFVPDTTETVVIQTTIRFGEKNMLLKENDNAAYYWNGGQGGGYEYSAPPFTGWSLAIYLREDDASSNLDQDQGNILVGSTKIPIMLNFNDINTWQLGGFNTQGSTLRPYGFVLEKNDPINLVWFGTVQVGKRYWVQARMEYTGYSQQVPEWLPSIPGTWINSQAATPPRPQQEWLSLGFVRTGDNNYPPLNNFIEGAPGQLTADINFNLQLSHFAMNVTSTETSTSVDNFNRLLPDPAPIGASFMSGWYSEGLPPNGPQGAFDSLLADCRLNGNQTSVGLSEWSSGNVRSPYKRNNWWRWVYTDDSQFLPHYQMFQGSLIHSGYGPAGQSYFKVYDNLKWNLGLMPGRVEKRNSTPSHMKITGNISVIVRGTFLDNNSNTQRNDYPNRTVPRIALRWLPDKVGGIASSVGNMYNPFSMFQSLRPDINARRVPGSPQVPFQYTSFGLFSPYVSDIAVHQKATAAISGLLHPDLGWDYSKEIAFITGKKSELVDYRRDLWRFPHLPVKRWRTSTTDEYGLVWQVFTTDVVYEGEVEWLIPWDLWTGAALNNPSDTIGGNQDDGLGWSLCCALTKSKGTGIGIVSGGGLHYSPIARGSGNPYSGSSDSVFPDILSEGGAVEDSWGSNRGVFADIYRMDFKFEEVGLHATKQLSTPLAILNKADKGVFGYPVGALKGTHTTYYNSPYNDVRNQATIPEVPHNNASLHRNIDYYYKIVNGNSTVAGLTDNKKSAIRLRRINEEYALIDYNITVEVQNPEITNSSYLQYTPWCLRRIDFGGPRWTQYLRFIYTPDNDGADDAQYNIWGSNWWLSNWSTYKQWYPGSAVVGGEEMARTLYSPRDVLKTVTGDDSPFYQDWTGTGTPSGTGNGRMQVRTWNGNMLDLLSSFGYAYTPPTVNNPTTTTVGSTLGSKMLVWEDNSIFRGNSVYSQLENPFFGFDSGGTLTEDWMDMNNPDKINRANLTGTNGSITNSGVFSAFAADRRMIGYAAKIFNAAYWKAYNNGSTVPGLGMTGIDTIVTEAANQQTAFMKFLGASYSLWGNLSYMRNKNTQWRITPVRSTNSSDITVGSSNKSNSFLLEVQLSDPILHVTTPFGENVFGSGSYWNFQNQRHDVQTVTPYKYLTLSGQAIIRFEETTVLTYNANYTGTIS